MIGGGEALLIIVAMIGMIVIDALLPADDPYWDDEGDGRGRDAEMGEPK